MGTLSAPDKNTLMSYAGFKNYVEDESNRIIYVRFVVEWRNLHQGDALFLDDDFIAVMLRNYMQFYDSELPELMRRTLQDRVDTHSEIFYLYIAQYFVDLAGGRLH